MDALSSLRPLVLAIREAKAQQDRALAEELLSRLTEALQGDALPSVEPLLQALRPEHLAEGDRERAAALVKRARDQLEEIRSAATFDRLTQTGDLFEARDLAQKQLAARENPAWRERLDAAEARLLGRFPSKSALGWSCALHQLPPPFEQLSPDACLEADGDHAWLAVTRGEFCFLFRIGVSEWTVRSCTVLRTAQPMIRPRVALLGERLCLVDTEGRALVVELGADGCCDRIVRWATLPGGFAVFLVDPGRDPALRWVVWERAVSKMRFSLWDLRRDRQEPVEGVYSAHLLHLPGLGCRLVRHEHSGDVFLVEPPAGRSERALPCA